MHAVTMKMISNCVNCNFCQSLLVGCYFAFLGAQFRCPQYQGRQKREKVLYIIRALSSLHVPPYMIATANCRGVIVHSSRARTIERDSCRCTYEKKTHTYTHTKVHLSKYTHMHTLGSYLYE